MKNKLLLIALLAPVSTFSMSGLSHFAKSMVISWGGIGTLAAFGSLAISEHRSNVTQDQIDAYTKASQGNAYPGKRNANRYQNKFNRLNPFQRWFGAFCGDTPRTRFEKDLLALQKKLN